MLERLTGSGKPKRKRIETENTNETPLLDPNAAAGVVFERLIREPGGHDFIIYVGKIYQNWRQDPEYFGKVIGAVDGKPLPISPIPVDIDNIASHNNLRSCLERYWDVKLPLGYTPGDTEIKFLTRLGELANMILPPASNVEINLEDY